MFLICDLVNTPARKQNSQNHSHFVLNNSTKKTMFETAM